MLFQNRLLAGLAIREIDPRSAEHPPTGEIDNCCFQNTLLRFRPTPVVRSDFALVLFRRFMHAQRFLRESRITTNLAHLTLGRFLPVEFPLPPIDEQREIARRVAKAEAAWDREAFDADIASALRQAILAAAFRGDLGK
jgi:type I restriction enzyme, S subunit